MEPAHQTVPPEPFGLSGVPAHRRLSSHTHAPLPKVWRRLVRWFCTYSQAYLRRHFHSCRVSQRGAFPDLGDEPVVVYLNHASWWDPLVCLFLQNEFFAERTAFAPMEAAALQRYPMFQRLGFFGVEQGTARGAIRFVRTAQAILGESRTVLWITPQGQFQDVRHRPVSFREGLGHLAGQGSRALFLPLAVEYVFWDERLPEILVRFGDAVRPSDAAGHDAEPAFWTSLFQQKLEDAQNALAAEAQTRDPRCFRTLLRGRAGVGAIYDAWRSLRARRRGEGFNPEHRVA